MSEQIPYNRALSCRDCGTFLCWTNYPDNKSLMTLCNNCRIRITRRYGDLKQ
jgi:hypothetical protein